MRRPTHVNHFTCYPEALIRTEKGGTAWTLPRVRCGRGVGLARVVLCFSARALRAGGGEGAAILRNMILIFK